MTMFAHIAGVPVEELLPSLAAAGGALAVARAWLTVRLRRGRAPRDP
jgi:hypothetical protein